TGAVAAILNAAIGIGLASALWEHPHVWLLITAMAVACLACNRIYRGLAHRYKGLETHYEFVSSVVRSTDLTEIMQSVLAAARKLLRANDAVLLLRSTGEGEPALRIRLGDAGSELVEVAPSQHAAGCAPSCPGPRPGASTSPPRPRPGCATSRPSPRWPRRSPAPTGRSSACSSSPRRSARRWAPSA